MRFEFATAGRILFGCGTSEEVPGLAIALGRIAFVVVDSRERAAVLLDGLTGRGLSTIVFLVEKEPDIDTITLATQTYKERGCDLVIGFGGGAAIDTGKAVAALAANPWELLDYLEVVGAGKTLEEPSVPYIAIPTTAGTGSEVTRNAVITVCEKRVKVSLRSPFMLPRFAVVDPELTYSLPPAITASTGMDALAQVLEPFVSNAATPMTDALCRDGIALAGRSLLKAYRNGQDGAAREAMALVSLFGGIALGNAKLGAVHGLAGPLGGIYPAPHGVICARLLPLVLAVNARALRTRQPDSPALERYVEAARLLTGKDSAGIEDGINFVQELCQEMAIPQLGTFGLRVEDFPDVVQQAQKASSMKGNPIQLTDEEVAKILEAAI